MMKFVQRVLAVRASYEQEARTLRAQSRFSSEQQERRVLGRIQTLERVVNELDSIEDRTSAPGARTIVEKLLKLLAEHKATWIANYIHDRRQHGINELGQWQAEGAIEQIDSACARLVQLLPPVWRLSERRHGHYFRLYQRTGETGEKALEQEKERWSGPEQAHWYLEVAILIVEEATDQAKRVWDVTRRSSWWRSHQDIFWIRQPYDHRYTDEGDVIVSVLSHTAWIVGEHGCEVIEPAEGGTKR